MMKKALFCYLPILMLTCILTFSVTAQTITGAWKGKIGNTKVELKLVKSGDSLSGTSYYYISKTNYRRYSVKGYFDPETNAVIWWDDWLIEDHSSRAVMGTAAVDAQLSVADFNCPGETVMLLDGTSNKKESKDADKKNLHLEKITAPQFTDDWDWVIENYTVGANDPYIIDSINQLQGSTPYPEEKQIPIQTIPAPVLAEQPAPAPAPEPKISTTTKPSSPEEKFASRKKVLQTVIPVTAETIELRFYDNAQVDGDSIALFLNGRLIFEHIRLTEQAYTIKIKASDLGADNELVMVAENLGSIPPNTSFMVAIVGDKRYEARLFANENSSAMVRIVKQ